MEDVALTSSILETSKKDILYDIQNDSSQNIDHNLNNNNSYFNSINLKKNKSIAFVEIVDLDNQSSNPQSPNNKKKMQNNTNNSSSTSRINSASANENKNLNQTDTSLSSKVKSNGQTNTSNTNEQSGEIKPKKSVKITSRIVFLKVGQIDTRNERFDAEAFIECSWEDDVIFKILADPDMAKNIQGPNALEIMLKQAEAATLNTNDLINLKNIVNNISLLEYDSNVFWSPQLYIENAIGELKEEIRHRLEIVEREGSNLLDDPNYNPKSGQFRELINSLTVRVCEMRKLRGVFYERLELYDFPMDMQELSITLTSKRNSSEIQIVENLIDPCSINTEDFLDQQEWDLFSHVKTSQKTIYDPWRKYERAGFSVSCYIARKPGYYLYNAYMLIFLITILGFVPYAFDAWAPQFRCQVTGLLLLTSVNFRWVVTQRLPSVPYLTSLDKYAIGSLLYLVLFCVWHSIIGSNIITENKDRKREIDTYVLIASGTTYLIYNFSYLIWFVKMYKSIRKFQNDGLKQAAIQAEKREKLNKLKANTSRNSQLNENEKANYEKIQKKVRKEMQLNKSNSVKYPSHVSPTQISYVKNRLMSQPNTSEPTFMLNNA